MCCSKDSFKKRELEIKVRNDKKLLPKLTPKK